MSRRTSNANSAVEEAWKNERGYVSQRHGTRDWSSDQQKDISEKGKAYDENGKAFEGHHMKSVEAYPQHQGDPKNIQFLTRAEHKAAHNANFHNATNGYYDPRTGRITHFAVDSLQPCKAEKLSNASFQRTGIEIATARPHINSHSLISEESMEQSM